MLSSSSPKSPAALSKPVRELLAAIEGLHALPDATGTDPRADAMLLLRTKAVPELDAGLDLPVFVGIQGGTNVGKSTVFNALIGKLLSPSLVVASATKHPLVFAHEKWREKLLKAGLFPGLECRELSDPKELITGAERTDILFFRFHDDARTAGVAFIDSPDFDSALATNAEGAAKIAAISDVTLFVTTTQKYRDRVLVEHLQRLLELKAEVIAVFNLIDEPIVFETIVDDLRATLGPGAEKLRAVRVAPSRARHPEDEIRESLSREVLDGVTGLDAVKMKPAVVERTVRKALDLVRGIASRYSAEIALRREVMGLVKQSADECRQAYRRGFQLALPEETLAIRRVLRETELGPRLALSPAVERSSKLLGLAGASFRRIGDAVRRVLVRLTRSDEGVIEAGSASLEEYARARNQADTESVARILEPLRIKVESLVRGREESSALARELVRFHFTPQGAAGFAAAVRDAHGATLRAATGTGEEVVGEVDAWLGRNPGKTRAIAFLAIAFKLAAGATLAWALPPAGGAFAIFQPLKWLYFAAGYVLAAYVIALIVSLRIRRRKRFLASRAKCMDATMRAVFTEPLERALDELLSERDLDRIGKASRDLEKSLGSD